jgi:hypothetical protein
MPVTPAGTAPGSSAPAKAAPGQSAAPAPHAPDSNEVELTPEQQALIDQAVKNFEKQRQDALKQLAPEINH